MTNNTQSNSKTAKQKKSIFFWGGLKGGVGKSFACRCMLEFICDRKWTDKIVFVEADPEIGDVDYSFDNDSEIVTYSDNKYDRDEPNIIIDMLEEKSVVVNLPSNVSRQFDFWVENAGLLSADIQVYCSDIVYFFVTDGCYQSINQFLTHIKKYKDKNIKHCLVFNPGRLTCGGNFSYLENFQPLMDIIKQNNIPVLQIPELSSNMQFEVDRQNLSYRKLQTQPGKITAKRNIKGFLDRVNQLFQKIFPDNIDSPSGLAALIEQQEKYRKNGQLSFLHSGDKQF